MADPILRIAFGATATRDRDDIATVRQHTHDQVIADLGPARTSPVSWRQIAAPAGAKIMADDLMDRRRHMSADERASQQELIRFLNANPGGLLIVATAECDPEQLDAGDRDRYDREASDA